MNIHSSEHLFLYIYLSLFFLSLLLPSPWLLPTQDSCVLQSVLADSGTWALGYWVWGETAWRATCWGCAIPGHSFPGYGFCLGDHHTQRQHRAGEATKPSSLSTIGLPACSNRPWRMLAPKRQGHEPGVLFPSDAIFPPIYCDVDSWQGEMHWKWVLSTDSQEWAGGLLCVPVQVSCLLRFSDLHLYREIL